MHLFGAEVAAFTDALEQAQHPLALGRQPLAPAIEGRAQGLRLGVGGSHGGEGGQGELGAWGFGAIGGAWGRPLQPWGGAGASSSQ